MKKKYLISLIGVGALLVLSSLYTAVKISMGSSEVLTGATTKIKLTDPNSVTPYATSTPTANLIPIGSASTSLQDGWLGATNAGDLVYSDGANMTRLGIGTAGQVLQTNSGATAPSWTSPFSSRIYTDPITHTFTNSGAENTILTTTIPGGTLSTSNTLKFRIYWNVLDNNNEQPLNLRLKYGATTISQLTISDQISANSMVGFIDGEILGAGATNSQIGSIKIFGTENKYSVAGIVNEAIYGIASGTATEDSTVNKTFSVTMALNSGNADFQTVYGYVEISR